MSLFKSFSICLRISLCPVCMRVLSFLLLEFFYFSISILSLYHCSMAVSLLAAYWFSLKSFSLYVCCSWSYFSFWSVINNLFLKMSKKSTFSWCRFIFELVVWVTWLFKTLTFTFSIVLLSTKNNDKKVTLSILPSCMLDLASLVWVCILCWFLSCFYCL